MVLLPKLTFSFFLLFSLATFAQDAKTVFITRSDPNEKEVKPRPFFGQLSLSIPLRANPYRDNSGYIDADGNGINDIDQNGKSVIDYIIPDGLSVHAGYGMHLKTWAGISINTGMDWMATEQLVSVPVYGSLIFNPQIWEQYNIYLQFGAGHAFAIGRGNLSGSYQKYRIGLSKYNEASLYIEANTINYPIHGRGNTGNISIGISFFDFL